MPRREPFAYSIAALNLPQISWQGSISFEYITENFVLTNYIILTRDQKRAMQIIWSSRNESKTSPHAFLLLDAMMQFLTDFCGNAEGPSCS